MSGRFAGSTPCNTPRNSRAASEKKAEVPPPSPDSPWEDEDDVGVKPRAAGSTREQIEKDIARLVQTPKWQADAMMSNVFNNPGVRRPLVGRAGTSAPVTKAGSGPGVAPPTSRLQSMKLSPGKRLRLN